MLQQRGKIIFGTKKRQTKSLKFNQIKFLLMSILKLVEKKTKRLKRNWFSDAHLNEPRRSIYVTNLIFDSAFLISISSSIVVNSYQVFKTRTKNIHT